LRCIKRLQEKIICNGGMGVSGACPRAARGLEKLEEKRVGVIGEGNCQRKLLGENHRSDRGGVPSPKKYLQDRQFIAKLKTICYREKK